MVVAACQVRGASLASEDPARAGQTAFAGGTPGHIERPVPEIADRAPVLGVEIALLAADAAVEIARFDTELSAEAAPFASVLLRSKSALSSEIENLTCGAKSIALAELGSEDKRNAAGIAGGAAMVAALDLARRAARG